MSEFTLEELAKHKTKDSLYVSIGGKVYDVTNFIDEHPGGEEVLLDEGGKDATEAFEDVGHSDEARELLKGFEIGGQPPPSTPKTTPSYPNAPKLEPTSYASYLLPFLAVTIYVIYKYMTISTDSPNSL
nr:15454_t:CDS:2 [Entrophospora candida]